jgi:hypothetical protein
MAEADLQYYNGLETNFIHKFHADMMIYALLITVTLLPM